MLLRFILVILGALALNACGKNDLVEKKQYRFFVVTDDAETKESVQFLVDRYNGELGSPVLSLVDNEGDANSKINFTQNLQLNSDHKLGVGQWITIAAKTSRYTLEGKETKTEVTYGMDISFDKDNFVAKQQGVKNQESDEATHLYHLFCHEVGHGMQLEHVDQDDISVMYPYIPDTYRKKVKFDEYFEKIRSFLQAK